ncbi:uncharacterized protein CXQ87_002520 [Candidozyma duobushaemuli]|uniref:Uncharacterized protein n=1 Tax=Candidozyma duobushaemuli TaxID=1231522 RepID=A0A2V1A7I6_9ASCO|nr:uncharacterized protein CXQ87_002520 [[Candida] duobushaemulonis]PVH14387.1 hypothetical protein CXQ87_002520 [[Candida] duobushaemulonis]
MGGFPAFGCLYSRHNRVVQGNHPPSWILSTQKWFLLILLAHVYQHEGDFDGARDLALRGFRGTITQLKVVAVIFLHKKTLGDWKPADDYRGESTDRRVRGGGGEERDDDDDNGGSEPQIAEEKAPEALPSYETVASNVEAS